VTDSLAIGAPDPGRSVLVLEASTANASVAVFRGRTLQAREMITMGAGTADTLFPAVLRAMRTAAVEPQSLGAVVCGSGPGSFTSLRIAAAIAKGLGLGADCPLYSVPSSALAVASLPDSAPTGTYFAHSDALRGERYLMELRLEDNREVSALGQPSRVAVELLERRSTSANRVAVGSAPSALPSDYQAVPRAELLMRVRHWDAEPLDLASWEPSYGRLAEAQVKWEAAHGRELGDDPGTIEAHAAPTDRRASDL
jgi:tRNA threonylcarbamoyladenosine biosynthesis protein TsaB